jgi:hypothetical protein
VFRLEKEYFRGTQLREKSGLRWRGFEEKMEEMENRVGGVD